MLRESTGYLASAKPWLMGREAWQTSLREGGPCHWRSISFAIQGDAVLGEGGAFLSEDHRTLRRFIESPRLALRAQKSGMRSHAAPWVSLLPRGLNGQSSSYYLPRALGPVAHDLKLGHTHQGRGLGDGD